MIQVQRELFQFHRAVRVFIVTNDLSIALTLGNEGHVPPMDLHLAASPASLHHSRNTAPCLQCL